MKWRMGRERWEDKHGYSGSKRGGFKERERERKMEEKEEKEKREKEKE